MAELTRRSFFGWAATGTVALFLPEIVKPRRTVLDMARHYWRPSEFRTRRPGLFSDPWTWEGGFAPTENAAIVIRHSVALDQDLRHTTVYDEIGNGPHYFSGIVVDNAQIDPRKPIFIEYNSFMGSHTVGHYPRNLIPVDKGRFCG